MKLRKHVKRTLLILVVAVSLVAVACSEPGMYETSSGAVKISVGMPYPIAPMDGKMYRVFLTDGSGYSFSRDEVTVLPLNVSRLHTGVWTVTVQYLDTAKQVIAQGSASFDILSARMSRVTVFLTGIEGDEPENPDEPDPVVPSVPTIGILSSGALQSVPLAASAGDTLFYRVGSGSWQTTGTSTASVDAVSGEAFVVSCYAKNPDGVVSQTVFKTFDVVGDPTFSPSGRKFTGQQSVQLGCTTSGARIYYTLDGTTPSTSSQLYVDALSVTDTTTVKAFATKSGMVNSRVASNTFEKEVVIPDAPVIGSLSAGAAQSVTISAASGDTLYYQVDGGAWQTSTTTATVNATAGQNLMIAAYAKNTAGESSQTVSKSFNVVSDPAFSPNGGTFTTTQSVQLSCATSGASIYYTTNGSAPSPSSSAYSSSLSLNATATVKAIAAKAGMVNSHAVSAQFTKSAPAKPNKPTFSPGGGEYETVQNVTIATTTSGATIYYTTDGTTPTESSTRYTGPISVEESLTLKAVAVKDGVKSDVMSADYTLTGEVEIIIEM